MTKTILLIESGKENFRGFTLDAMARSGISLVLVDRVEPTWQKRYISDFIIADPDAPDFVEHIAQTYGASIGGVLTFVERHVPLAAQLARRLGVLGIDGEAALAARDKVTMRRKFAQAGLWTPKQLPLSAVRPEPPADFHLPAVVKPVMGFASINVMRIDDWSELDWVDSVMRKDNHPTTPDAGAAYLIEEYIDGPEFSVESAVAGETIVHYAVTQKFTSPEPFFEEIAHVTPAPLSAEDTRRMFETAGIAVRALGLDRCVTHTEIRLSPTRGPVVIEVAARLGGDKIPYLVELATGASPSLAAARIALGEPLPPAHEPLRHVGIAFFVPQQESTVTGTVTDAPPVPGLVEFVCTAKVGQHLRVPPELFFSRLGHAVVEGASNDEVRSRMADVVRYVESHVGVSLHTSFAVGAAAC